VEVEVEIKVEMEVVVLFWCCFLLPHGSRSHRSWLYLYLCLFRFRNVATL